MISHHAVLFCSEHPLTCSVESYVDVPVIGQYRIPQLSIDNVRALIQEAYRRPDEAADKKIIMVATEFVTEEAQQALLKIIEEPPASTIFVFVVPHGYTFLPTLESRFERKGSLSEAVTYNEFANFKSTSFKERFAAIELASKQKDTAWQSAIKKGLVQYLRTDAMKLPSDIRSELEYVSRLLLTRGASNKFLLEHLALLLPA
jgi:DNA polymerase III, delta subunit